MSQPVNLSQFSKSEVVRLVDFSGGQNTTVSPSLLNANEAVEAVNMSLMQKGTITARQGRRKRYNVAFGSVPVTGLGGYYKKDGTSRLVVAAGDKVYADEPYMGTKWTTRQDYETGTVGEQTDVATVSGEMRVNVLAVPPHTETKVTALSSGAYEDAEYAGGALKLTKMGVDFASTLSPNVSIPVRAPAQTFNPVLANGSGTNYAIDTGVVSLSKVVT